MRDRRIRNAALAFLPFALACATKSAAPPPPQPAPAPAPPSAAELAQNGGSAVLDADIALKDSSRNRDLSVRVTYPDGAGPFPVIVFSHGAGGSPRTYDALARFWASHDFVVVAPDHADSGTAGGKDPAIESAREPAGDAAADPKGWETRERDLAFVAAATGAVEARVPALKGKLDETHVGVGGQSYGAFAAMLVAGATVEVSRKAKSFSDPIPRAFLLISPPGKGQQGLTEQSWTDVTRPLMVITGTRDLGSKNQDPSWRLDPYQLGPPGGKYAVFIEGASHLSFTGLAAERGAPPKAGETKVSPDTEVAIFKAVKIATLAFWEAYLRENAKAKAFLQTDALMTESGNQAQLLRR